MCRLTVHPYKIQDVVHVCILTIIGIPEIILTHSIPLSDHQGGLLMQYFTSVYEVSAALKSALPGVDDRMFMCFRSSLGHLLGASHGKFFSLSNIDFTQRNPLITPPPFSELYAFSALDSDDSTIYEAGVWLIETYQSWASIPELNVVQALGGEDYWITAMPLISEV
jgi:hypothetical protein